MDCGDLVEDFRRRIGSDENFDSILSDLEYGVMAELEEFARKLIVLLTEAEKEAIMFKTNTNGLSANSQQAKTFLF